MKVTLTASLASFVLTAAVAATSPASAADFGGSVKDDGYVPRMPVVHQAGAGPCYFRGDVGASISRDPDTKWPVFNTLTTIFTQTDANGDTVETGRNFEQWFIGDKVSNIDFDNTWLGEVGIGCGSGSRGFRADMTFGFRGKRDFHGEPFLFRADTITENIDANGNITRVPGTPRDFEDPLNTSIKSYTLMFNAYYDFGRWGPVVPYIGAGVGAAYHIVDDVFFTGNPFLVNQIEGDRDLSFAWSVMGGLGYQISERAVLDVGYRYIDMGKAKSGRVDSAGFVNPRVRFDDIAAHEIKVGLRYHFGSGSRCCEYEPFK